jgi:hypothetical protein
MTPQPFLRCHCPGGRPRLARAAQPVFDSSGSGLTAGTDRRAAGIRPVAGCANLAIA